MKKISQFKNFTKKAIFWALSIILIFSLYTKKDYGQQLQDKGIIISPVKYEYDVNPGDVIKGTVKLYNLTSSMKTLYLKTLNFEPLGETGYPAFKFEDDLPYNSSLKMWIQLETTQVDVQPSTPEYYVPKQVNFTINVPEDATPGGHYAGIIQSLFPPDYKPEDKNLVLSPESACLIIVNVRGDVKRLGNIEQFYVTDPFLINKKPITFFEYAPVQFIVRVRNYGNTHFKPQGNIILYKGKKQIATFQVNEKEGNVLKESIRKFEEDTWGENNLFYREPIVDKNGSFVTDEKGNVKTKLKFDISKIKNIPIGKYTANIILTYDDNGVKKQMTSSTSFWIIPWKIILIIIAILLMLIAIFVVQKKIRKSVKERKSK
jgi:hypothetical protein